MGWYRWRQNRNERKPYDQRPKPIGQPLRTKRGRRIEEINEARWKSENFHHRSPSVGVRLWPPGERILISLIEKVNLVSMVGECFWGCAAVTVQCDIDRAKRRTFSLLFVWRSISTMYFCLLFVIIESNFHRDEKIVKKNAFLLV